MELRDFPSVLAGYDADRSFWDGNTQRRVRLGAMRFALAWVRKIANVTDHDGLLKALDQAESTVMLGLLGEATADAPPPLFDIEAVN